MEEEGLLRLSVRKRKQQQRDGIYVANGESIDVMFCAAVTPLSEINVV